MSAPPKAREREAMVGIFGRRKTYDEAALEEARARDGIGSARRKDDPDAHMLYLMQRALAGRFQRPDPTLASAIEELRRKYAGHPPADVKPALTNALKGAGHQVPESFVDMMAPFVTGVHE